MKDQFYMQDSRSHAYGGDGLSFWRFGGTGYVTNLAKSQVFTMDGACDHRDTAIPWPKAYIDARARVGVDCQNVTLSEALDQPPDAAEFYVQKPQCWNGNNLIWLWEDGVFTSDLSKAVVVPRAHSITWIGKIRCGGLAQALHRSPRSKSFLARRRKYQGRSARHRYQASQAEETQNDDVQLRWLRKIRQ